VILNLYIFILQVKICILKLGLRAGRRGNEGSERVEKEKRKKKWRGGK
jgi:hypothetical protein